ncbi:MAG: N-acetylmuramoyl-L-alanine amidase, partial [Synergistaceae bacterium]|nr:N-acetylmuramoyl-L-alanine amidase [Synergistaceae bacterium]
GIDVRLTRNSDVYLTLKERTNLANQWNAEVFISIHANALPKGRHATGMEIYLMALPTDKDAMQLALIENRDMAEGNGDTSKAADSRTKMLLNILGNMQQNAKISESTGFAEHLFAAGQKGKIKMRRVAQAPFFVLRGAAMPSVLIETGFLTEKSEARMLSDGTYQNRMADSLAEGIAGFLATL